MAEILELRPYVKITMRCHGCGNEDERNLCANQQEVKCSNCGAASTHDIHAEWLGLWRQTFTKGTR